MKPIATLLYDLPAAVAGRLTWLAPLLARVTVGWVFATTGASMRCKYDNHG